MSQRSRRQVRVSAFASDTCSPEGLLLFQPEAAGSPATSGLRSQTAVHMYNRSL